MNLPTSLHEDVVSMMIYVCFSLCTERGIPNNTTGKRSPISFILSLCVSKEKRRSRKALFFFSAETRVVVCVRMNFHCHFF